MTTLYFTKPHTWDGGYYELALVLGQPSDERLSVALATLWSQPQLDGCYLERGIEPNEQPRVPPSHEILLSGRFLYGIAQLPNNSRIACSTSLVREDEGEDWLYFILPVGALAQAYDVGAYPFDEGRRSHAEWQKPLDDWLAKMGQAVFSVVQYRVGLIDHEIYSLLHSVHQFGTNRLPEERYYGYLWPSAGKVEYFPRNK
jgi:hypothetical protein